MQSPGEAARFGRAVRLSRTAEFEAALASRPAIRGRDFALHLHAVGGGWRLGLVIPKRFVALSVRRNAIKRLWREAFRKNRSELEKLETRYDLVVRLAAKPKAMPFSSFRRLAQQEAAVLLAELLTNLGHRPQTP